MRRGNIYCTYSTGSLLPLCQWGSPSPTYFPPSTSSLLTQDPPMTADHRYTDIFTAYVDQSSTFSRCLRGSVTKKLFLPAGFFSQNLRPSFPHPLWASRHPWLIENSSTSIVHTHLIPTHYYWLRRSTTLLEAISLPVAEISTIPISFFVGNAFPLLVGSSQATSKHPVTSTETTKLYAFLLH